MVTLDIGISSSGRQTLTPAQTAIELFCNEGSGNVLTDTLGTITDLSLTGTTSHHLSDKYGWFTGSTGATAGDRYTHIAVSYTHLTLPTILLV